MTVEEPAQPPQDAPPPPEAAPQGAPPKRRMSGAVIALIATGAVVGLVSVATLGIAIYGAVTPDSGIVACEAIRDAELTSVNGDDPGSNEMTEDEYRELRDQFEDSVHEDIREHGTKLVDVVWQVEQIPDGQEVAALGFLGPLTEHATGLQAACARQGIHFSLN